LQINTSSVLGGYGGHIKDVAMELIDRGCAHFLGSDCHCHSGVYDFPEAVDLIIKEFGDDTADILVNENPIKMLENENIPYFYVSFDEKPKTIGFCQKLLGR